MSYASEGVLAGPSAVGALYRFWSPRLPPSRQGTRWTDILKIQAELPLKGGVRVTSKGLCQGEEARYSLGLVFMGEDGEQAADHGDTILEDTHGTGPPSDFAESAFDGIGGSHGLSLLEGGVTEASEQIVEVVAQGGDDFRIGEEPALCEAAGMGTGFGQVR